MAKAEVLSADMEEVLFEDDGIGMTPEDRAASEPACPPLNNDSSERLAWQVERIKQLTKRIQDLEGMTFKQKDVIERLSGMQDFLMKPS